MSVGNLGRCLYFGINDNISTIYPDVRSLETSLLNVGLAVQRIIITAAFIGPTVGARKGDRKDVGRFGE